MRTEAFFAYCQERYLVHLRRGQGLRAPWTQDPILQQFRFCNVFREDDRTTIWYRQNLARPLGDAAEHQLRASLVFRFLNRIETGERIKDLLLDAGPWSERKTQMLERRLREMVKKGERILGAAYMIKTPVGADKVTGLMMIWKDFFSKAATITREVKGSRNLEWSTAALANNGYYIGPFMAYEVVTDLRHTSVLSDATDIMTWANPGPGAIRGCARLLGKNADDMSRGNKGDVNTAIGAMGELVRLANNSVLWPASWPRWEMRDAEHNLCEFDKYERARLGEGFPKQRYRAET